MSSHNIGDLVRVRIFGLRPTGYGFSSYPYSSYGVIIGYGYSSYDESEGYYVFVQKTNKIEFFRESWIIKTFSTEENENESNV